LIYCVKVTLNGIIEGRQLGMFLLWVEDLYIRSQLSSLLLHYLSLLKLNTWQ